MTILVIGAGPVGLTVATELARRGLPVEIVDRRDGPSALSRAVGIIPNTIDKLRACGAGDAIEREGMKITKLRFNRAGRDILKLDFTALNDDSPYMVGLALNRTEFHLREALSKHGVSVQHGRRVVSVKNGTDSANVSFDDGSKKTYVWVVACDGVHSSVRDMMNIAYIGQDIEEEGFIADIEVGDTIDFNTISAYSSILGTKVAMGCIPIEKQRISIGSARGDIMELIEQVFNVKKVHYQATFKLAFKQAERYREGRVLLAGDSAHCTTPTDARGMNLGIDDALAVVDAIENNSVDRYSDTRKAVGAKVIAKSIKAHNFLYKKKRSLSGAIEFMCAVVSVSSYLQRKLYRRLYDL